MTGIEFFEGYESELRDEQGDPGERVFTVSGLTGVGTGTLSEFLAEQYGLQHIDAGQFFRGKAEEHGMSIDEFDSEADEIEEEKGIDFDTEWDRTALEHAFTEDDILLEGRLTGALLQDIAEVRVWVECDARTVAERLKDRESQAEKFPENVTVEELEEHVEKRNQAALERYREKYGVDPRELSYYNVVIDNSRELERVKDRLLEKVEEVL